jgi:hypothetical protein
MMELECIEPDGWKESKEWSIKMCNTNMHVGCGSNKRYFMRRTKSMKDCKRRKMSKK